MTWQSNRSPAPPCPGTLRNGWDGVGVVGMFNAENLAVVHTQQVLWWLLLPPRYPGEQPRVLDGVHYGSKLHGDLL